MGMNHDMIGHVYPPSKPYLVTSENISAFVKALGDTNPAYAEGTVAPPTFPIVVTMNAMDAAFHDPALQLDYARLVHSDQKFEYLILLQFFEFAYLKSAALQNTFQQRK